MLDDIRAGEGRCRGRLAPRSPAPPAPRSSRSSSRSCKEARLTSLASVTGDTDLATHDGQFLARILGAVAKKESDDKSRRISRKHQELAQAGKLAGGGDRPFGYRSDRRTVEPTEAAAIREAAARVRAGDSLRAIASDWNARGIHVGPWRRMVQPGPASDAAQPAAIRPARLPRRDRGERRVGVHPDAPRTAQLSAILGDPARLTRRTVRRYLLSGGLLRCSFCDAVLVARPRGDGTRRYVCAKGPGLPGCGRIAILAEPLEALVTEAVLYRLDTPELAEALAGAASKDVEADAAHASVTAGPCPAGGACPRLWRAPDHVPGVPCRPQAHRGADRRGTAQSQPVDPDQRDRWLRRRRRDIARQLGRVAAHPSASHRGRGLDRAVIRPAVRGPDPLRPRPRRAGLAALTPEQHDDRLDRPSGPSP